MEPDRERVEEEIYLVDYLRVLVRRWKWVVGVTAVAIVVASLASFWLIEPLYEATAGLMLMRVRSETAFEPKIKTREEIPNVETLKALAESPAILKQTLESLNLTDSMELGALLDAIKVNADGDFITLSVRHRDPGLAARIANTWGRIFEARANELFATTTSSFEEIQKELSRAKQRYAEAQERLNEFIRKNKIPFLKKEIELKEGILADSYRAQRLLLRLLADAEALRKRLEGNRPLTPGDGLSEALLNMRASMTLGGMPPSVQFQIKAETSSKEEVLSSLDSLIASLRDQLDSVRKSAEDSSLRKEILALKEELERQQALKRELTQARDLAWETYRTVARKLEELRIARKIKETPVRFASPAVEPQNPVIPKPKLYIAVAAVLGLFLGIILAFLVEHLEATKEEKEK